MVDRRGFLASLGLGAIAVAVTPIGVLTDKPRPHMFGCEMYVGQMLLATCRINPIPEIEDTMRCQINRSIAESGKRPMGKDVGFEVLAPWESTNETEHICIRAKRYAA